MTPIPLDIDGVLITLKAIERNKAYECKCEEHQMPCQLKQKLPLRSSQNELVATEVLLNIRNVSTDPFPIDISSWELIDTEGYARKAQVMCDPLRPPDVIDLDSHSRVSPGTQVDLILMFPELKRGKEIACLAYGRPGELHLFQISKSKRRALDLVQVRERLHAQSSRIEDCKEYLELLRQEIQSGLSKALTRVESESLDKKITKLKQAVVRALLRINQADRESLESLFQVTVANYQRAIESARERSEERKKGDQTLDGLRRLSFGEFEEYVKDLFELLGYEKVTLRGKSGDQGADILCEKNGERVAIQCKRYKGKVGSPEVQALLGAMQSTESQRGFLVTTGCFSLPAERITREAPIELINGNTLVEWIAEARAK